MYALSFGGPGSGIKGHQPLYHGTSSDVLDKILKEGVRPKSASPHGGSDVAYATSNFGQAQLHAHIKAQERGAKPVVVELHGTAGTAGTTAGFKPEHIKAVHELDSDGKMKRRLLSETTMKQVEGFYFLADLSRRFADAVDGKSSPYVQGKWFQLAKTGTFYSPHYGKVEVSPQMLSTMVKNFKTITPLAPTQLPIDYDHLSDDPQKPGDGRAAGWVEDLRLSPDGQRLEFLPKWTKPAAEMIAKGEYRFVSPFFLTQYMDKRSGKKVGPTLKAVAITNRPFLEGMQEIPAPAIAASERIARQFSTDRRMAVAVRKRHVLAVINAHGRRMECQTLKTRRSSRR